jgi:HD superfamily phosphodiesterase
VQCIAPLIRQFKTSSPLQLARKNKKSTIRIPSKKAIAAKARRKTAVLAKEEQALLKLPLVDAIAVLRVSMYSFIAYKNPNQQFRLSRLHHQSLCLSYMLRPESEMASQYQEEESLFQEKQSQDQKIKSLYLPKEDMPTKQEGREHTSSVVRN